MNGNRPTSGLIVGLAVVAAVVVALQPKTSSPPAHPSAPKSEEGGKVAPAEAAAPQRVAEGPLKPVYDFLGPGVSPPRGSGPATRKYVVAAAGTGVSVEEQRPGGAEARLLDTWPSQPKILDNYRFRFLIASVPDPVDSGFAYMFDQVLEALQRALDADDFVIDRAWLPWQPPAGPASAPAVPSPRWHELYPGLVLFRCMNKARCGACEGHAHLLAVLLVGETPTGGIHKTAFDTAVRIIRKCPAHKEEGNRVRVIGPFFSGSADSLRLALEKVREEASAYPLPGEPLIKVVNGSARSFSPKRFLGRWTRGAGGEPPFESTILPDEVVLDHVWKFLDYPEKPSRGKPPRPIIMLTEANTGFGWSIDEKFTQKGASKEVESQRQSGYEFIRVPFPFHISQLRAAYSREQLARLESQGLPRVGRNLPFPIEGDTMEKGAAGVLRAHAPLITAATNDLVLSNLVTVLAQRQARRICLASTDPQDTIFLARMLHDRHPDVQLITAGHDLLYAHEEYSAALRGMVVAGTYSLSLGVQRWSDLTGTRSPQRILFSNQGFQGYYNAALVQLAATPRLENGEGKSRQDILDNLLDYGWERVNDAEVKAAQKQEQEKCPPDEPGTPNPRPARFTLPPILISVVAANGQLVPVRCIPPQEYLREKVDPVPYLFCRDWDKAARKSGTTLAAVNFPNLSFLLFVLFLVGNGWFFYHAYRFVRDCRWDDSPGGLCCVYRQRIDFGVVCLAQVLVYGQAALLVWAPLKVPLQDHALEALAAVVILLLSGAMMALSCVLFLRVWQRPPGAWSGYARAIRTTQRIRHLSPRLGVFSRGGLWLVAFDALTAASLILLLLCFAWRVVWTIFTPLTSSDVLDFERLVRLSNGVTPLLPRVLFCGALFAWSFCLVKKLFLANRCRVECPFPGLIPRAEEVHPFAGLWAIDRQIRSELMPPSTLQNHFWVCLGLFAFMAITLFKFQEGAVASVDGWWHTHLSLLGFCLGALVLQFTLVQFYFAWRVVRKMLHAISLLPMQNAFQRVGDKVLSLFGGYLFSRRPRHSHLMVSVQQFQQLQRLFPAFHAALAQAAQGPTALGSVDGPSVARAWSEVDQLFPAGQLTPALAGDFEQEVRPADEHDYDPPEPAGPQGWGGQTGEDCSELARRCLLVLRHFWPAHSMEEAFGRPTQGESQSAQPTYLSLPPDDPVRQWAVAAEEFCATEITRYLSQFVVQIRTLLTSLTVSALLLLVAAVVYPFFPQYQLLLFLTALGALTAGGIVTFLVQLNRDELISRINRTTPDRFTPDLAFLQGAATYVLPILAALMVQFPIVTSTLRSLLDPLFHIVK